MADSGRWFKLWCASIGDPDMDALDIADFGRWAKLGAYIKEHGEAGGITIAEPGRSVVSMMQLSSFQDVINTVKKFKNVTVSHETGTTVSIHIKYENWHKYQGDFSTERVRKFRSKNGQNETPKKRGEEKRGEEKESKDTRSTKRTADPRVKEVIDYFHGQCQSVLGFAPAINGGQDGTRVLAALRVIPLADVKKCIDFFLPSKKCKELGCTLSIALSAHTINLFKQGGKNGTRFDQLRSYFGLSESSGADRVHRAGDIALGGDKREKTGRCDTGAIVDGEAQKIS